MLATNLSIFKNENEPQLPIDFSLNEHFLKLMQDPSSLKNIKVKSNVKNYLLQEAKYSEEIIKNLDLKNILQNYWQEPPVMLKNRDQFIFEGYGGYTFTEAPFARCDNKEDKIIKLYHLALLAEEKELANIFKKTITTAILEYLAKAKIPDHWNFDKTIHDIAALSFATDCFDEVKDALKQKGKEFLSRLIIEKDSYTGGSYYSLLSVLKKSMLIDEDFLLQAKEGISTIKELEVFYCRIVNFINSIKPNTITLEEQKPFALEILLKRAQNKDPLLFEFDDFAHDFLQSYLINDREVFSLYMENLKPAEFYPKEFPKFFAAYFDKDHFNDWQKEIIKKHDPRVNQNLEEKRSFKM